MPKAQVGAVELCFESMGEGPTVLLIMGLGAQLVLWPDEFCQGFVDRGYRVVRFDNRDTGQSTRLDHLGVPPLRKQMLRRVLGLSVHSPYELDAMADDAVGLLDALEIDQAHVMGASMGGMISQLVALRHPKRVASLTSIMSHPGDRLSLLPRPRALRALFRRIPRDRREAQDAWVRFYRVVGSTGFDFDEESVRERAGLHFDRGPSPKGLARQMSAVMAAEDRRAALRSLKMPTLVVHGTIDPLVRPRGGEQTARAIEGAELLKIEGMGHDLPRGAWPRIFDAFERVAASG